MGKMGLYRLERSPESYGTARLLPMCALLFSFLAVATADPSAGSSLFRYAASGFSYEIRLRSYERSEQQPVRQNHTPPQALSRVITATANEDTIIPLSATNTDDSSLRLFLTSVPDTGKLYQYLGKGRGGLIQPGAAVSDPHRRVIFAPAPNGGARVLASHVPAPGTSDNHFDFVANDAKGL